MISVFYSVFFPLNQLFIHALPLITLLLATKQVLPRNRITCFACFIDHLDRLLIRRTHITTTATHSDPQYDSTSASMSMPLRSTAHMIALRLNSRQEKMIFSVEIMDMIIEAAVDEFRSDTK